MVRSGQAAAEEEHAEQLQIARAELQRMLHESQEAFEGDVSRLECALDASKCDVKKLESDLAGARAESQRAVREDRMLTEAEFQKVTEEFEISMATAKREAVRVNLCTCLLRE